MKKRIFSGVQPSGNLHIGNYLGAIKNWVELQNEFESIFCVVDLHAITVPQSPEELKKKTLEIAKIYLAAGIDPKKSTIFVQSHVPEHSELMWILNTITKNGDLTKMTQFKDKTNTIDFDDFEVALKEVSERTEESKPKELIDWVKTMTSVEAEKRGSSMAFETARHFFNIFKERFNGATVGLFDYPVLMAADILLYDTEVVPVGEDQKQHVELARDIAKRFNHRFGETFIVPEAFIKKEGMRVMGLDDPMKKMSKSATSEYNFISLLDESETIRKKIKKAVTDSGSEIEYSDSKPALKNLINIYASFSGKKAEEIVEMYAGKGYGDFKADLAEVIIGYLEPFQARFNSFSDEDVLKILKDGAEKVSILAKKKLKQVKEKVGFVV